MSEDDAIEPKPKRTRVPRKTNAEIKDTLSGAQSSAEARQKFEMGFEKNSLSSEREYAHLIGLQSHYRHKGIWSYFLAGLMFVMVVFQCVLLGLVGGGVWNYKDYKWLLPALLAQNFAQIVGLAIFVVKALFKDLRRD